MTKTRNDYIDEQTDKLKAHEHEQYQQVQSKLIPSFILDISRVLAEHKDEPVIEYLFDFKKFPLNGKSEDFLRNVYLKAGYNLTLDRESNPAKLTLTHVGLDS